MRFPLVAALFLLAQASSHAPTLQAQRLIKANLLTTVVGVPQVAYERPWGERRSLQFDLAVSPWRSVDSAPAEFAIFLVEGRHHFRESEDGPYAGIHTGLAVFRFQRWDFRGTDRYQEGFGVMLGATVGLQLSVGERWGLDAFLGGGTIQSKYKGYSYVTGLRYDGEAGWNESGEWLIYRGGLMLSYRLP